MSARHRYCISNHFRWLLIPFIASFRKSCFCSELAITNNFFYNKQKHKNDSVGKEPKYLFWKMFSLTEKIMTAKLIGYLHTIMTKFNLYQNLKPSSWRKIDQKGSPKHLSCLQL